MLDAWYSIARVQMNVGPKGPEHEALAVRTMPITWNEPRITHQRMFLQLQNESARRGRGKVACLR